MGLEPESPVEPRNREMQTISKLLVEVIYEGDHCIPCVYMAEAVQAVVSKFGDMVEWRKVHLGTMEGAIRFAKLSGSLPITNGGSRIPVPSIFLNGRLTYVQIPSVEELEESIKKALEQLVRPQSKSHVRCTKE